VPVCQEISGRIPLPGDLLREDGGALAFHVPPLPDRGRERPYLGHLLLATRRHVDRLEDLTDAEGTAVGRGAGRLSRARGPLSSLGRRIQAPHDLRAGDSRALTRIYCTS